MTSESVLLPFVGSCVRSPSSVFLALFPHHRTAGNGFTKMLGDWCTSKHTLGLDHEPRALSRRLHPLFPDLGWRRKSLLTNFDARKAKPVLAMPRMLPKATVGAVNQLCMARLIHYNLALQPAILMVLYFLSHFAFATVPRSEDISTRSHNAV